MGNATSLDAIAKAPERERNERPFVSFAVFAYNQEKYVREAVEGAFSQTYQPLEIILSDDCSTDRTFEIMQEMAMAYQGPHEVRVRRCRENGGTLRHVLDVAETARGRYLVVAAGDDISMPHRTAALIYHFIEAPALAALTSSVTPFTTNDDYNRCLTESKTEETTSRFAKTTGPADLRRVPSDEFQGCGACYRISFLRSLPTPETKVMHEDVAIALAAQLQGLFVGKVSSKLLFYRITTDSLSARHHTGTSFHEILQNEEAEQRFSKRQLENISYYKKLAADSATSIDVVTRSESITILRAFWHPVRPSNIVLLRYINSAAAIKYVTARLLGRHCYCWLKSRSWNLRNKQHT